MTTDHDAMRAEILGAAEASIKTFAHDDPKLQGELTTLVGALLVPNLLAAIGEAYRCGRAEALAELGEAIIAGSGGIAAFLKKVIAG